MHATEVVILLEKNRHGKYAENKNNIKFQNGQSQSVEKIVVITSIVSAGASNDQKNPKTDRPYLIFSSCTNNI